MSQYVNKCTLEVNGVSFTDFESVTINSVTKYKAVNLMNKTGFAGMTERYTLSVNVKENFVKAPIDLELVKGGTITIEYENGDRDTFAGVYTLETGDGTIDGETELTKTVTFGAESKF